MEKKAESLTLTIRPLTPALWPALEDLFGKNGACVGELAVGWCQGTPRDAVPWLDRTWRLKPVDDVPVWSISCLCVRKGYRRKGITSALVAAAVETATREKAPAIEAYPVDSAVSPSASGTGYVSTFPRAGFRIVARRTPARPIMRRNL
jgi:GNAT superfamily N-acetyltransferase